MKLTNLWIQISISYLHAKINEKYIKFFYLKFFQKNQI